LPIAASTRILTIRPIARANSSSPTASRRVAHGRPIQGDFRDPRWETVADIEAHVGCHIKRWPAGIYTALAVAGEEAGRLRDEAALEQGKP
jgi:hypothetical protein